MLKTRKVLIFFIIESLVLLIIGITIISKNKNSYGENLTDKMQSRVISLDGDGFWEVNENEYVSDGSDDLLFGPYIGIDKGTYTIYIDYEADEDQCIAPFATEGNWAFIKSGSNILESGNHKVEFHFEVTERIDNFETQIKYNGKGHFKINELAIYSNVDNYKALFLICFLLFFVIDIGMLGKKWFILHKVEVGAVIFIILLASLPLTYFGINKGHDLEFHLCRIEGIVNGIRNGVFPVRMQTKWLNGYGYPVSIYYGDFLLYFPALFRIMGFSINTAYKAYIIFINSLTTIISYLSFYNIFGKKRHVGILLALAYTTSTYRLSDIYIRGAVGEYSAITFFPLIVLASWKLYTEERLSLKKCVTIGLTLAVGMSGIICTHVLSAEMVAWILFINAVMLFYKTINLKVLLSYMIAIIMSIFISSAYLIPFLDYYTNENVKINNIVNESIQRIQCAAAYLADYFTFFKSPYGWGREMLSTPGVVLIGGFVLGMMFWGYHIATKRMKYLIVISAFTIWLSTNLFPWDSMTYHFYIGNFLSQVQYPWRYISISCVLLCLVLGELTTHMEITPQIEEVLKKCRLEKELALHICYVSTLLIGIIMTLYYVSGYCTFKDSSIINYHDTMEITSHPFNYWEYLKVNKQNGTISDENAVKGVVVANNCDVWNCDNSGAKYCFMIKNQNNKECSVTVPIFNYRYYRAIDSNGQVFDIKDGDNNTISFMIPGYYEGEITIEFISPWYWRLSEFVSLITIMLICLYVVLHRIFAKDNSD